MLIHDEPVHGRAMRSVLAGLGVRVSQREYEEKYMVGDDAFALTAALRDAGMPPGRDGRIPSPRRTSLAALVARKRRRYRELMGARLRLDPGAVRLLRALSGKIPLAIVSAAAGAEIRAALRASGLAGRVKTIVSCESVRRTKPHPEPYRAALRSLAMVGWGRGSAGGALLTFEDSPGGIASALAAGMTAIGVSTSYNAARLKRAGARAVVPDLGSVDAGALLDGQWPDLRPRSRRSSRQGRPARPARRRES